MHICQVSQFQQSAAGPGYDRLSFRFQQNLPKPQLRATGKLNASEQGHPYTFPVHAKQHPEPSPRHRRGRSGCLQKSQACAHASPAHLGPRTPVPAGWALLSARKEMEISDQDCLLKRNWGAGVEEWGEPLCQRMKRILSNQIDSEKLTFKCPTVSCNLQITLGVQSHCKV